MHTTGNTWKKYSPFFIAKKFCKSHNLANLTLSPIEFPNIPAAIFDSIEMADIRNISSSHPHQSIQNGTNIMGARSIPVHQAIMAARQNIKCLTSKLFYAC